MSIASSPARTSIWRAQAELIRHLTIGGGHRPGTSGPDDRVLQRQRTNFPAVRYDIACNSTFRASLPRRNQHGPPDALSGLASVYDRASRTFAGQDQV